MNEAEILEIARDGIVVMIKIGAPIMVLALVVGLAISLVQALTQIQEATLSFVPKAVGVGAAILFSGNWMLHEMITFTTQLFEKIPQLLG